MMPTVIRIAALPVLCTIVTVFSGCQVYQRCRLALQPNRCKQCEQNAIPHGYSGPGSELHPIPANGDSAPAIPENSPRIPAPAPAAESNLRRIPFPQNQPVVQTTRPTFLQRVKFGLRKLNPLAKSQQPAASQQQPTLAPPENSLRPTPDPQLPQLNFPEPAVPQQEFRGPTLGDPHQASRQPFGTLETQPSPATNGVEEWPYAPQSSGTIATSVSPRHHSEPDLLRSFRPAMTSNAPIHHYPAHQPMIPVVRRNRESSQVQAVPVSQPRTLSIPRHYGPVTPRSTNLQSHEPGPQLRAPSQPIDRPFSYRSGHVLPEENTPIERDERPRMNGNYRSYRGQALPPMTISPPRFSEAPVRNFN